MQPSNEPPDKSRSPVTAGVDSYAAVTLDARGHITGWSTSAEQMTGYRAEEVTRIAFSRLCAEEESAADSGTDALDKALQQGRYEHACRFARKDGSRFPASVAIEPLRSGSAELIGFAGVIRDVSECERIAHDFNNVAQVVSTALQALKLCAGAGDSRMRGLLELLERNTTIGANMIQQLLAYRPREEAKTANPAHAKALAGLRVLVVEDESLIAMHVEDMLDEFGCEMIARAKNIQEALELARTADVDFALVDINLHGQHAYPVASALKARGVPFAFMSGDRGLDEAWRQHPLVHKPLQIEQMQREMERALRGA